MRNLAIEFLEKNGKFLDVSYDGLCGELVDDIMHWLGEDKVRILYIEPRIKYGTLILGDHRWCYHVVPVIDGLVHDAWQPDLVLDVDEYVLRAFPGQIFKYSFPAERSSYG